MPFENFERESREIEQQIVRHGMALGMDWNDAAAVRQLAQEAVACRDPGKGVDVHDARAMAKMEIFGLAQLMLTVMRESADAGLHTHGGAVWKIFAKALWEAADAAHG